MQRERIPSRLDEARAAVAKILRWPQNVGIEMRTIHLQTCPATDLVVVFIRGLADEELVRSWAIEPLQRLAMERPELGPLTGALCEAVLPAARLRQVDLMPDLIDAVLGGATALLLEGPGGAVVVETRKPATRPVGSLVMDNPYKEIFGPDLPDNVGLIRCRLHNPDLLAEYVDLPEGRPGRALLVQMVGKADPALVAKVRDWVLRRAGEQRFRLGQAAGQAGMFGLLPDIGSTHWPDKAATLLDAGYVVAMVEQVPMAFVAPVTTAALLLGPGDDQLRRPISIMLRYVRVALCVVIITAPALVVALLNYHHELIPTPFLISLAASRESAALPVIGEIAVLQILQEIIRESMFRLPMRISTGSGVIAGLLLCLILFHSGLVGAVPAFASALTAFATFGLPSYTLIYLVRIWQYPMILGAAVFGLYGITAVTFAFATYLCQAKSFGVPYISETGVQFATPGRESSRPLAKGGNSGGKQGAVR
ncbi:MAG TPA: spore germination protein [Symbiobacteriaceae bacterium]